MIDHNDPRLTGYVLGELSASVASEIEQAINSSPELATTVEEIRAAIGMLGEAYAGEEQLGLRDEQKVSLAEKSQPVSKSSSRLWRRLGIAATLAGLLFVSFVFYANYQIRRMAKGRANYKVDSSELQERAFYDALDDRPILQSDANTVAVDFDELTKLVQGTVDSDSDSWFDNGTGEGQISPFPSNLSLDVGDEITEAIDESELDGFSTMPIPAQSIWVDAYAKQDRRPEQQGKGQQPNGVILPTQNQDIEFSQGYFAKDNLPSTGGIEIETSTFSNAQRTDRSTEELLDELLEGIPEENPDRKVAHRWEMRQQIEEGEDKTTRMKMQLLESQALAELVRQKVGTGHPDYEAALAQVAQIERTKKEEDFVKQLREKYRTVNEPGKFDKWLLAQVKEQLYSPNHQEDQAENSRLEELVKQYREHLKGSNAAKLRDADKAAPPKPKSWKRVKAIPNTTRLMVGDKEELNLTGMQVNAQVDGFRARVLVDYFYYNDRERQLEGNFKLRLPDDASLYYFAFGESAYDLAPEGKLAGEEFLSDGTQFVSLAADDIKQVRKGQWDNVKEARMVPREKAAHAFRETVRRRVDPALVEWSGAGVFSAKVFPLAPKKLHRIVVGYDVNLKRSADGLKFELALPEQRGECRVELNVQDIEGVKYSVSPEVDPIPADLDGNPQKRYVFESGKDIELSSIELSVSGANNVLLHHTDNTLPLGGSAKPGRAKDDQLSNGTRKEPNPPRSLVPRSRPSQREGDVGNGFWTVQVTPDLPIEEGAANSRAIFMVDTSLSSSPDKFNVWLNMLESTLNNNRETLKEFDVLFFNVDSHFWKGKYTSNTPENVAELKQTLNTLALEGATDLYGAVQTITEANWVGEKSNRPDLFLLSDGGATWGETDLRLIDRLMQQPQLGSLFAYQTGLNGTAISGLRFLAGQSGGAVFSVATEDEIKTASTAHRNRPWQLKSITADGASDILTAGRVQWVYPGQTITVVGRGSVNENIQLDFQQANETKTVAFKPTTINSELASRMYGQVSVRQLESLGSQVFDVSAAYARHFRVTGKTCSLLMLESEEDYQRFDIKPEEDLFVVKAKATSALVAETLLKSAEQLADPKAKLQAWLNRLESMPGMAFKMPTALKLAMDDIQIEAISQPLNCTLTTKDGLSDSYLKTIANEQLDYDPIATEANRRAGSTVDDAIKVYSSLVERNPGDIIVARDIAFTAMEMDRPAQAFHLLRRVARARPFQGNIYPAIGQCLTQLGKADMAIVYYEIAMNGTFQRQGGEFKQIVAAEYIHLLRQIVSGKLKSSVKEFAAARLETLGKHLPFGTADVVITMMWNQDQTDVDMHVVEPSGEECYYEHKTTRSGGQITSDITTGFGPEMYYNANAPQGKYQLKAKFFGSGQNRTSTRNKIYMTIIRGFGTEAESITRRTIQLSKVGEVEPVMTLGVE